MKLFIATILLCFAQASFAISCDNAVAELADKQGLTFDGQYRYRPNLLPYGSTVIHGTLIENPSEGEVTVYTASVSRNGILIRHAYLMDEKCQLVHEQKVYHGFN